MNYTEELGLKLPELDESFDLEGHWNHNTRKIDEFASGTNEAVGALQSGLSAAQSQIAALQGGVRLKGSVNYYSDLPENPDDGDAYTVLYFGTSGQEPAGIEYAWVSAQNDWIPIGVDPAAFAKPADIAEAINDLDVAEVGGSGKYISAISETNGKISATPTTFNTGLSSSSTNGNAPTSKAVYDDQERQEVEIGVVANAGAKNFAVPLDPISTADIIVTRNANGSYTFACTNVSENRVIRVANIGDMTSGTYKISGVTGGSSSTYMLGLYNTSSTAVKYQNTNHEESYMGDVSGFSLRVRVIAGYSGTFTVYPMIRPASITDSTFVPYAKTNRELTVAEAEDRAVLVALVDGGAKNFVQLGFTSTSGSSSVPATTNNNDGTITVNGSRVGNATILVQDLITAQTSSVNTRYTLPAGNYVIAPTGNANIGLQVYKHDGTNMVGLGTARLEALSFTYSDTDKVQYPYICIRLFCEGNSTINNFTVMPMICTAKDYAISPAIVPYRPSWQEMWTMIQELQSGSASTLSLQPTVMSAAKAETQQREEDDTDA